MAGSSGGLTFTLRVVPAGRFLDDIQKVLDAPMGSGRGIEVTKAMRVSIANEFSMGAHSLPGGGTKAWDDAKPFGTRELPAIPLGGPSGFLARAWAGGANSMPDEVSPTRVAIGVEHPAATMHRGGSEGAEMTTVIDLTVKAASFLRHEYAVDTEGGDQVHIPSRPHATTNPELERQIVAVFHRAFGGQP